MKNGKYAKRGVATKALVVVLAVMMIVGATIGGTIAWLVDTTETVTNTFSVGDINISLWENDYVSKTNTLDTNKKVTEESEYKIVPGASSPKNPTLTIDKGSEKCWVYVTIENNLVLENKTVADVDIDMSKWTQIGQTVGNKTLYRYNSEVDASAAAVDVDVFEKVSYDGAAITKANIGSLKDKTIVINGYAHQSANTTQDVADAAATAWAFPTAG